jgi:hypothetical protein
MWKDIVEVTPCGGHVLRLRFEDGVEGRIDLAPHIRFTGVFQPLRNPAYFAQVALNSELGTIVWPNGADLAPEVLYELVREQPSSADRSNTSS